MKRVALLIVVFAAMLLQAEATPARAAPVGWVSALGHDSQTCTVADPCETFAAAITQTFVGGVVRCLGPVGFNSNSPSFTITASITIDCKGSEATMVEYGAGPFTINAPGAVVTLRGIDLNGVADSTTVMPTSVNGVVIQAAAVVNIEDCVIENFPQSGISVTTSANTVLNIKNTTFRNSANGISFAPTGGSSVNGSIDHATIVKMSGDGISGTGATYFTVTNSVISNAAGVGVNAVSGSVFEVDSSSVSNNNVAFATSNGYIRISRDNIYDNNKNYSISGGVIFTSGDNYVAVNGSTVPNGSITRQ